MVTWDNIFFSLNVISSILFSINSTEFLMNVVSDEESLFAPSIHVKKGEFDLDNYNKKYK